MVELIFLSLLPMEESALITSSLSAFDNICVVPGGNVKHDNTIPIDIGVYMRR